MDDTESLLDVLVVGHTPPPFMGQALAIQAMLDGRHPLIRWGHVRMTFSTAVDQYGRFSLIKLWRLAALIVKIIRMRRRTGSTVLYYVPAGPQRVPMYRDFAILLATRRLFSHVVFHFHAAGLSDLRERLTRPERWLFKLAYDAPDLAIRLSPHTAEDGLAVRARAERIVLNGVEDVYDRFVEQRRRERPVPRLVFIGLLRESKGVLTLLRACRLLQERGAAFELRMIGEFVSQEFAAETTAFIEEAGLGERVEFTGLLTDDAKWRALADADILAFPSHYETCPLAVIEAMSLGLPVVSTCSGGIPSLVDDGETGLLTSVGAVEALTDALDRLLADPALREGMGRRGRERYLAEFTLARYQNRMAEALLSLRKTAAARVFKPVDERA